MIVSFSNRTLNLEIDAPVSKSIAHRELIVRTFCSVFGLKGEANFDILIPDPDDSVDIRATKECLTNLLNYRKNPDGTYATVVLNSSDENVTAVISDGQNHFRTVIPAQGVVSCKW